MLPAPIGQPRDSKDPLTRQVLLRPFSFMRHWLVGLRISFCSGVADLEVPCATLRNRLAGWEASVLCFEDTWSVVIELEAPCAADALIDADCLVRINAREAKLPNWKFVVINIMPLSSTVRPRTAHA